MKKVTTAIINILKPVRFEEYVYIHLAKKDGTVVRSEGWECTLPSKIDELVEEGHKYTVSAKDKSMDRLGRYHIRTLLLTER